MIEGQTQDNYWAQEEVDEVSTCQGPDDIESGYFINSSRIFGSGNLLRLPVKAGTQLARCMAAGHEIETVPSLTGKMFWICKTSCQGGGVVSNS